MPETEEKTKVVQVPLPSGDYLCQGEIPYLTGWAKPGNKYDWKYEWRLPVPTGETIEELGESAAELYGEHCTVPLLVKTAIRQFATRADDNAKLELNLRAGKFEHETDYDEAKHLAMQSKFESWKVGIREVRAVTEEEKAAKLAESEGGTKAMLDALRAKGVAIPTDEELGY
jgi:hypothetical protein